MADSGQDKSSETNSKTPGVRLRGFQKKDPSAPPVIPVVPPVGAKSEVRFRRRTPATAPAPAVDPQPDPATPPAPVPEDAAPAEQTWEQAPVEEQYQSFEPPYVDPQLEEAQPQVWEAVAAEPQPQPQVEPEPKAPPAESPQPSIPAATVKSGVRLRFPPKPAVAAAAPESYPSAPVENPAGRQRYTADNNAERVLRRQWWKYDLRVKAGRQGTTETQEKV